MAEKYGKAAIMVGFNVPFKVKEYPVPKPEKGAALVKMLLSGVCGTDVHTWMGQVGGKTLDLPVILGHENVGEIIELGEGLNKDWVGEPLEVSDRVTWPTTIGRYCYKCYNCVVSGIPVKCLNRRTYGAGISSERWPHFTGGWAQYVYIFPETALIKLPKTLPTEALVACGCAAPTMVHTFERAGLGGGETVVIQGSGALGLVGIAMAREYGAEKIIVIGGPENRLKLAEKWGADHVIDISEVKSPDERVRAVYEFTNNRGADIVIEVTGIPSVVSEGVKMVRDGGKYLVVGQFMDAGPAEDFHPFWIVFKYLHIIGVYSFEPKHVWKAVKFVDRTENKYKYEQLITHKFPLEKVTEAVKTAASWKCIRAAIDPWL